MIAAIQDLAREPNQEASEKTAAYLSNTYLMTRFAANKQNRFKTPVYI